MGGVFTQPGSKAAVLTAGQPLPVYPDQRTFSKSVGMSQRCHMYGPAARCKTEAPRPTNVRAATMYQASNVEHLLRAIMGIRAHPRLTSGKTSLGHHGPQSLGCAGQTVRPSLHSISQTSVGKLSILNYSFSVLR